MSKTEQSIQFIQITPEELSDLIAEKVKDTLIEYKKLLQEDHEEYLTKSEVAKILKISMSSVWLWTKKGKLQSYGIEGRVYYKRSEIEKSLIKL